MNTDESDLNVFKSMFMDKYVFEPSVLDDMVSFTKYTDFLRVKVKNLMVLDVHSYEKTQPFMGRVKSVRAYSNDKHEYLGKTQGHTFYGWYDHYQDFDVKERLKLYRDIHRVYDDKGNKVYISSPYEHNNVIAKQLGYGVDDVYVKKPNEHNTGLFKHINKIVYWHTGFDTNNRTVVESYIHDIPIEIHYNGYENDSIKERYEVMYNGNPKELFLTEDDVMIKDFVDDCTG
jgi:hypothetical protein